MREVVCGRLWSVLRSSRVGRGAGGPRKVSRGGWGRTGLGVYTVWWLGEEEGAGGVGEYVTLRPYRDERCRTVWRVKGVGGPVTHIRGDPYVFG